MLSFEQVRWWIGQFFVLILCFSRWRYKDNSTLRHNLIRVSQEQRTKIFKSWLSDSFYRGSGDQRTRSQSIYSLYLLYVTPPGDNFCENVQFYVCQFCVKQWVSESYCPTQPDSMHTVFPQRILFDFNFSESQK